MPTSGPRIEIIVDPKGITRTEAIGIQGGDCQLATAPYEIRFGDIIDVVATAEAYEDPHEVEIKSQQRGNSDD